VGAVKSAKRYRFNYRQCREASCTGDGFKNGVQMRDIWDIPTDHRDSTGHPAPKPVALYTRILDVAGRPRGTVLDPFSGGGTGAIAAMRSGMRSVSIEPEIGYVELIKARVAKEMRRRVAGDGSSSRILAAV
jgi:DNA modification methylase